MASGKYPLLATDTDKTTVKPVLSGHPLIY